MKIGIIGGSFDPPHLGHLGLGELVLEKYGLDKILYIVTYSHALGKKPTDFEHRMEMANLAFQQLGDQAEILDIEKDLPVPSYTINTIRCLKQLYPQEKLYLIIGSDITHEKHQWKSFDEIERVVNLITIPRKGFKQEGEGFPLPDIRSREIRKAIQKDSDVSGWISPEVLDYIRKNNLYS